MDIGLTRAAGQPLIVIVDDDAALLAALKFKFETEGLAVESYQDAESALRAPAATHHCLVLDQKLPGLSGLDLLERLRGRGEMAPALLITTHPGAGTRARAQAAGVEIVEKPLLGDDLVMRVLSLVSAT